MMGLTIVVMYSCARESIIATSLKTDYAFANGRIGSGKGEMFYGELLYKKLKKNDERLQLKQTSPLELQKNTKRREDFGGFVEQSTKKEILVTGIKVVDFSTPYQRGGKIGLFGGVGVGSITEHLLRNHFH
ncbi:hypothetical protein SUGI_0786210 [Cryptomeria japonica]|nr:hypothetical protein SUGI_0786210 [Cryptomeria japonica]